MAWQVVTGFPSFMVDVPETVLVTLVFLVVVKPRDSIIRMLVVTSAYGVLLPVALVLADMSGRSVG